MLFTFPSRYWFTIGRQRVFSLGGWSPQIQTGFHVPRPTQERIGRAKTFVYGAITHYGQAFLRCSTSLRLCNSHVIRPTTPALQEDRFGLFPFRSPLLRESRLISLPRATEMFHFARFPRTRLCIQRAVHGLSTMWVAPFGNPRIKGYLRLPRAYRSLSRPSSASGAKASTVRP